MYKATLTFMFLPTTTPFWPEQTKKVKKTELHFDCKKVVHVAFKVVFIGT